jgi:hypothetical protein
MNNTNFTIEKSVNEIPLKPTDAGARCNTCPGCNTALSVISNCVLIGGWATYLCKGCGDNYTNGMHIINAVQVDPYAYAVDIPENMSSALPNNFLESARNWFDQHSDRKYRFRSLTPEEKIFFIGRVEVVFHLQDDGKLTWELLASNKPDAGTDDEELSARIYFLYAKLIQNLIGDSYDAMKEAHEEIDFKGRMLVNE